MSVQTVLLDFSIEPSRIEDEASRKDLVKLLEQGLSEYFPNLKMIYEVITADGYLCLFSDKQTVFFNTRLFNHGIITINVEYFKAENEQQKLTFDVSYLQIIHLIHTCTHMSCPFSSSIPTFRHR